MHIIRVYHRRTTLKAAVFFPTVSLVSCVLAHQRRPYTLFVPRRPRVAENANANCAYQFTCTSPFRTGHLSRVTFKPAARNPISAVRVYRVDCACWFFRPVFKKKIVFLLHLSDRVQPKRCESLRVWKKNLVIRHSF